MSNKWKPRPREYGPATAVYQVANGTWIRDRYGVLHGPGARVRGDLFELSELDMATYEGSLRVVSGAEAPKRIKRLTNNEQQNLERVNALSH